MVLTTQRGALALVVIAALAAGVLLFSVTSLASPEAGGGLQAFVDVNVADGDDPDGHAGPIGMPNQVELNLTFTSKGPLTFITIGGDPPWVEVTGAIEEGQIFASGSGKVADIQNIAVEFEGKLDLGGQLSGEYRMGTALGLPPNIIGVAHPIIYTLKAACPPGGGGLLECSPPTETPPAGEPTATPTNTPPAPPACPPASVTDDVFSHVLPAPLSIPDDDPTGVTDCISVNDMGTINDLNVVLAVRHTYVGDLIVTLTHEGTGTTVTLIDRPGVPAIDEFGCAGSNIDATLDDQASSPIEDECGLSTPTIFGSFTPNEPLAAFNGESMAGTWTITISDHASFDLGTLNSWSLIASLKTPTPTPTPTPSPTPTPTEAPPNGDVNKDGVTNSLDVLLVLQTIAALVTAPPNFDRADVNGDGEINGLDAVLILQFEAGLLDSLPVVQ